MHAVSTLVLVVILLGFAIAMKDRQRAQGRLVIQKWLRDNPRFKPVPDGIRISLRTLDARVLAIDPEGDLCRIDLNFRGKWRGQILENAEIKAISKVEAR
jgi:hypothetical protein